MKIAHLNTLTYGGAAVVARRVHEALLALQTDSILLTKYGVKGMLPHHFYFKDARLRNFLRKSISNPTLFKAEKFIQKLKSYPNISSQRDQGFEMFSPLTTAGISTKYEILNDRDVLNLHWINSFIGYESFFKRFSDKKFVWTLHDMNPFTGGCHHSDGCMRFELCCNACPQLKSTNNQNHSIEIQKGKLKALECITDDQLVIACPSKWILELSQKSRINSRFKHVLIPNPSFEEIHFAVSREDIRKELRLPLDKKIILFASDNLKNPRKGVHVLFEATRLLKEKGEILLLGIGHHQSEKPADIAVSYSGSISDSSLLAKYFYCADIFVIPSIAENSPLVVLESLSCGTPVVGSNIGGIPDLINYNNGILFPVGSIPTLSQAIRDAVFRRIWDRESIMRNANDRHNPLKVALQYNEVYSSLLA